MISQTGWSARTIVWQAWCRVAAQARSGMTRIDANSLKNLPLAIDACIILKPLAVTATASKPTERSDVPSRLKRINFRSYIKNAFNTRWQSFKLKSSAYSNKWAKDEMLILRWLIVPCIDPLNRGDRTLKNPRAALTLPGGDLILVTVKHYQNPNSTRLTMPRRRSPWPMWAKPLRGLALPALKWLLPMASNNHLRSLVY